MIWLRSFIFYLIVALIALFIGAVSNQTWGLIFALSIVSIATIYHLVNLVRLNQWLKQPHIDTVPSGFFLWQDVFDELYGQIRSQKKSKEKLANNLKRF